MVVRGMPVRDPSNLFRVGMLAVMVTGMRAASPRIHAVLFVLGAALFVVFVAFFQFRLA